MRTPGKISFIARRFFFPPRMLMLLAALMISGGMVVGCDDGDDVATGDQTDNRAAAREDADPEETESADEQVASFTEQERRASGTVTGESASDALNVSKALPERIALGTPMVYQINVSASEDLSGVVVREQLPEGFEFENSTPEGQLDENGRIVTIPLGALSADQEQEIQITGTPQQAGQLQSCTTYDFERGVCTAFEVVDQELALTKAGPETASVCEPIVYTYALRNVGESEATDVVLYDRLPEGLAVVDGEQEVRFDIGTLAPGEQVEHEVEVIAEQPGSFESYAYAESNLDEIRSQMIQTQVVGPELNVAVSADSGWDYVGKITRFEVTVENTGEGASQNTTVDAELEGSGEIVGINGQRSGQTGRNAEAADDGEAVARLTDEGILLGTIEPGESRRFTVDVRAEEPGRTRLQATASAMCERTEARLASAEASDMMQFRALSALQVTVIDRQDPVQVGEQTIYEITIVNEGSASDANVQAVGQLPEGLTFLDAEGPTEVTVDGQSLTFAPVEELPAGESVTWYVTVEAAEAVGSTKFTVDATSEAVDQAVTAEEPTRLY